MFFLTASIEEGKQASTCHTKDESHERKLVMVAIDISAYWQLRGKTKRKNKKCGEMFQGSFTTCACSQRQKRNLAQKLEGKQEKRR